jgi:hypothetical protein
MVTNVPFAFTFENSAFVRRMYLVVLRISSDYILNNIHRLAFVTESQCVFCDERTEFVNITYTKHIFSFMQIQANEHLSDPG